MSSGTLRTLFLSFALLAPACSGGESETETLPQSVQDQLPIGLALGNLCPGAETPPDVTRDLERRAEALIRELRKDPDALVAYTFHTEEEGPITEEITLRELAEIELDGLSDPEDGYCLPELARRIEDALG